MGSAAKRVGQSPLDESQPEFERFRRTLKQWARKFAARVRRSDMAEDIESAALLFFLRRRHLGWECSKELERYVRQACSLQDDRALARDSDLTARVNQSARDQAITHSYVETHLQDPRTEDDLVAAIDGEAREEGRDQAELLSEVDQAAAELLSLEEDQVLSLRHLYGYSIRETARYLDRSVATVSTRRRQARERARARAELQRYEEKCAEDPTYSQLEVSWIRF